VEEKYFITLQKIQIMKTTSVTLLLFHFLLFPVIIMAQTDTACAVKIGSSYYINCRHIITFRGKDVLNVISTRETPVKINFDVYSSDGKKTAVVKEGKITEGASELFTISSSYTAFSFMEKSTKRIICYVKKIFDKENSRCELHVWADMYMPSGFYFQCTPETTNVEMLNNMKGATFKNSGVAISLN
jgi:hypothetical protein